jgi:hypothetical protein
VGPPPAPQKPSSKPSRIEKELQSDLDGRKWEPPKQPRKTYQQPPFQAQKGSPWTEFNSHQDKQLEGSPSSVKGKEPFIPESPRTDRSASPEGRVEDLSSDVGAFLGLGTPLAGDFTPRQELSWEDSTQELPPHSFAVEGDTTVIPKAAPTASQESVLTAVSSVVGGALKQAVVQLRPQLPPAEFFRPRRQISGPTIPLKEAGPVPGGWEDTVIYHQKPLDRQRLQMEQPSRHRQQPSESNVRRNPAPAARTTTTAPTAAAAPNVPPAVAATANVQPPTETATEDDRDEFLAALCHRLTLTMEERIMPRIQSLEDKIAARPREPEVRYGRDREFARNPELQFQGGPGPEYRERAYRDFDDRDGCHSREWKGKPRFRPDALPKIKYGDDVNVWIAEMDHAVIQHGEEIVCPEIFANCFTSGDAIKLWYMDMPSEFRTMITTKVGCWDRFKSVMEKRFTVDIGIRQMTAEDRCRMPSESYADFGIQKVFLIRRAFAHLAPSAVIAMVKRKLDWEAAAFCKERDNIDNFVSELIEFDNLRAMKTYSSSQRQSQWNQMTNPTYGASAYAPPSQSSYEQPEARLGDYYSGQPIQSMGPSPSAVQSSPATPNQIVNRNQGYADPRLPTVQARKHPQTGIDTLSYLDRTGKTVFIHRPCQHCDAAGNKNAWHFDFSCADKPVATRQARTYAGEATRQARTYAGEAKLPGTFDSPSGHPTSYTFNGLGSGYAHDPQIEDNPFSTDDMRQSGNGEWDQ